MSKSASVCQRELGTFQTLSLAKNSSQWCFPKDAQVHEPTGILEFLVFMLAWTTMLYTTQGGFCIERITCLSSARYMCTTDPSQCSTELCRCEDPTHTREAPVAVAGCGFLSIGSLSILQIFSQELQTVNKSTCYLSTSQPRTNTPFGPNMISNTQRNPSFSSNQTCSPKSSQAKSCWELHVLGQKRPCSLQREEKKTTRPLQFPRDTEVFSASARMPSVPTVLPGALRVQSRIF